MIVNPGIRRFLGSAIQRLFNSASFYAPLTHTLALERGTGSPTFTRASTATVEGYGPTDNAVDGLKLLTVAANEARFVGARRISEGVWSNTFADGSLIPAATNTGYLAEGARTNLCLQSNAFTTTWLAIGTPAATQNATGLDGGTTAWTLTDNDGAASEEIYQSIVLSAAAHTFSVFVKKTVGAQSSYPCLLFSPVVGAVNFSAVTIDTTNGIATAWTAYTGRTMASGISTSCVSYNDDFWRVSLTATATAEAWYVEIFPAGTTNATQSTGVIDTAATGSAVFYGAQVELGSFASSYIPTTTIAVARNADVLTYSSAGNISDTAGWCYAEASTQESTSAQSAIVSTSGGIGILELLSAATTISTDDGALGVTKTGLPTMQNNVRKVASSWGAGGQFVTSSGAPPATGAYDGSHSISAIGVGCGTAGGIPWFGTIRNVYIGQRQLSASELQAVTA